MKEMRFSRKQHFFQATFQHFKKTRNQETNHQIKNEIKKQGYESSLKSRNKGANQVLNQETNISIKYLINLNCNQYGKQE